MMVREMKDSGIRWFGEIPDNWEIVPIKRNFSLFAGSTPKSEIAENWDGDIVWITPADYKTSDKYVEQGKRNISNVGLKSCSTLIIPSNSIVFSKRAPIGSVAINTVPLCTNQGCIACIPKENVDTLYYYYVMSVFTEQFELYGSGTTFKEISATKFGDFRMILPPLYEQKKIADFLDKKCIEINTLSSDIQSQIDILENYKKSVITEAVARGLNFDVKMTASRIAWGSIVPAHWNFSKIKYEIFPLQRPIRPDDLVMTCFRDGEVTLRQNRREDGFTISFTENGYQGVEVGDLVIHGMDAFAGSIGCSDSRGKITPVVHVCKTTGNNRFFMYVLRSMAMNGVFMDYAEGIRVRSSDFRNFNKLGKFPIVVPPISEQNKIVSYLDNRCEKIDAIIAQKKEQLSVMADYKKSLIYEYVTGKREVPDNDEF